MLGQEKLQAKLLHSKHSTIIIRGSEGSGKTIIVKWLAKKLNKTYFEIDKAKVDDVREVVEHSNATSTATIYYFKNSDKMTNQAQNALLKVAEEPPKNATIIIGVRSIENVLPTISSRSITYSMLPYENKTMREIADEIKKEGLEIPDWAIQVAQTPGELIDMANDEDELKALLDIAETVATKIGQASLPNVLSISNKVPKDKELQFTYLLIYNYGKHIEQLNTEYINASLSIVLKYREQMERTNANKKNVVDMMLYEVWSEYRKWNLVN